jgi:hypothetical protein
MHGGLRTLAALTSGCLPIGYYTMRAADKVSRSCSIFLRIFYRCTRLVRNSGNSKILTTLQHDALQQVSFSVARQPTTVSAYAKLSKVQHLLDRDFVLWRLLLRI